MVVVTEEDLRETHNFLTGIMDLLYVPASIPDFKA